MDIVEIIWKDAAYSCGGTMVIEEAIKFPAAPAFTFGALIKQDKEEIILAMTVFGGYQTAEGDIPRAYKLFWTIPAGCIKEIRKLGEV